VVELRWQTSASATIFAHPTPESVSSVPFILSGPGGGRLRVVEGFLVVVLVELDFLVVVEVGLVVVVEVGGRVLVDEEDVGFVVVVEPFVVVVDPVGFVVELVVPVVPRVVVVFPRVVVVCLVVVVSGSGVVVDCEVDGS